MMAGQRASSYRRIHPAVTFLIRAFSPGCPTMLRSWSSKLSRRGENVEIIFDLPTDEALRRAERLVGSAPAMRLIAVGDKTIRELTATLHAEHRTLSVHALLVKA